MKFELLEQSIEYTFGNERYTNGHKSRVIKNVKRDAAAENLQKVGQAIAELQKDSLDDVVLIKKERAVLAAE